MAHWQRQSEGARTAAMEPPKAGMSLLRPLSMFERWSSARHESRAYLNFSLGVTLPCDAARTNAELCGSIRAALEILCERHAILRTCVHGTWTPAPRFAPIVDFRSLIDDPAFVSVLPRTQPLVVGEQPLVQSGAELDDLCAHIERSSSQPFDATSGRSLLWRVALFREEGAAECDVAFTFHHALSDGLGGVALVQQFVELQPLARAISRPQPRPVTWELPPPMEDVVALKPSLGYLVRKIALKLFMPAVIQRRLVPQDFYVGPRVIPPDAILADKTTMAHVLLPPALTASLAAASRARGTTVTGALSAALAMAVAALHARSGASTGGPVRVAYEVAANQRGVAGPEANASRLGSFVVGSDTEATVPDDAQFWALACAVRDGIQAGVPLARETMGLIAYVNSPLEEFMLQQPRAQPNGRTCTVVLSNLGRCDIAGARRLVFAQSRNAVASFVTLSAGSLANNVMCACLTWGSAIATPEEGRMLASDFASALRLALARGEDGLSAAEFLAIVCEKAAA